MCKDPNRKQKIILLKRISRSLIKGLFRKCGQRLEKLLEAGAVSCSSKTWELTDPKPKWTRDVAAKKPQSIEDHLIGATDLHSRILECISLSVI